MILAAGIDHRDHGFVGYAIDYCVDLAGAEISAAGVDQHYACAGNHQVECRVVAEVLRTAVTGVTDYGINVFGDLLKPQVGVRRCRAQA